jgi:Bacterial cellulose synthase subunit
VGQELTLNGIGIGAQTVYGANSAAEVAFPPAATVLAPTGNFVRIFFSQSPDAGAGSTMLLAVNGQPLLVVPLTAGTASGGVLETRLPSALLVDRQPVRLQVRFQLAGPAATLYGRLDGQTLIHYELAGSADGRPELEQYPFSMLAAGSLNPTIGVVLPIRPAEQDLAVAFRVLADLGRRATSQHIHPVVVTAGQESWLATGGVSSLLVGRVGSLPAAPAILTSAGWKQSPTGWTAPDGRALGPDDGLVLAAVSPWDHRSTLLLVTGGSAAGVAKAAAALVSGGGALSGPFVIASAAESSPPGAARNVRISVLSPHDLTVFGVGRYRATVGFVVPAVDPQDTAVLELTVPALGAVVPTGSVEADVNGSWVGSTALASAGARSTRLVASFPGGVLRPGRNSLSLEFRIGSRAVQPPAPDAALATAETDTAIAALAVPEPAPGSGDLRLLPFPFLEGGGEVEVVVSDAGLGTLGSAAQAMLALGSRSAEPPPELSVAFAPGWDASGTEQGLIVVGSAPGDSALAAVGAQLPVVFDRPGQVTMAEGGSGGRVRLSSAVGALQEVTTSDPSGRQVLWLAGTGQDVLDRAAAALYDTSITGNAALVDAAGRLAPLNGSSAQSGPAGLSTAQAAGVLAAVLILVVVAVQLLRPRRLAR